jgi:hypothetical protein
MLVECDADEGKIRIDDGCLERLRASKARALDGIANGIGSLSFGNAWIGIDELPEASADSATGRRGKIVFADTGSTG